ncbi:MAG: sigma-70 family RNA polymerase sigma factor [Spirochaetia bacterium]|nr:sigma-70 family RNA polymerase sigma factor [Spirochaetia bacterium]
MDEKELIRRIRGGETALFSEVITKYKKAVYNHAYNFLRNKEEAEDALQEIFISIYNNLANFRGDSKLSTWIYRITVNTCTNRLKQLQRHRAHTTEEIVNEGTEEEHSLLDGLKEKEEKEPDRAYTSAQVRAKIFERIDELTDEQKHVIMLRDVDGLSYEEIGQIMKLSVSAVKSKLFRARENLREKLIKDDIL